jgi:DNA-directed RNA polymerase subunit M/transcription elongation factor TFIIS
LCEAAEFPASPAAAGSGASESFLGGVRAEARQVFLRRQELIRMVKIAKTGHRNKVMDTSKSTNCPKCGKPTRIVKRVKDRERNVPGGVFISCSACEFYEKL